MFPRLLIIAISIVTFLVHCGTFETARASELELQLPSQSMPDFREAPSDWPAESVRSASRPMSGGFRGIPLDQGNNLLFSNSLNRWVDHGKPFFIDVLDDFVRDMPLLDSDADPLQIGFVPPVAGVPRWSAGGSARPRPRSLAPWTRVRVLLGQRWFRPAVFRWLGRELRRLPGGSRPVWATTTTWK